ncbi:MAG TPA: MBL fold metallo-hydrolase [Syntrophomonadaceae bacterium]|nr:MBL fold metallo-hydrolase [Syntrophomonadaceae bacterium]
MSVYLYLVDGLLIDTGPSNLKESTAFFKESLINQVALTHVHEDHSGMAAWLQDQKKVPIYLSSISIEEANKKAKIPFYRQLIWGKRLAFEPEVYKKKVTTEKYSFDVLPTPGHATDHVALFEKNEGWLFTGDLYLGKRPIVCMREENMPETISSLETLSKLDFDTMFCSHSGIHHGNGKEKIIERLDAFIELREKTEELHKQGLTAKQIDKKLYPHKQLVTYVSRGEWSSFNIINSLIKDK